MSGQLPFEYYMMKRRGPGFIYRALRERFKEDLKVICSRPEGKLIVTYQIPEDVKQMIRRASGDPDEES